MIGSSSRLSLAWLCPVCNKTALYTDLFVDQFFIDVIGKCSSGAKAIEYEPSGQWKVVGEEKPSRRAQREREAYKAAQAGTNNNGKSIADMDHSADDDSDDERPQSSNALTRIVIERCIFNLLS